MKGRNRIAIACAGVLLATVGQARAQTAFRETGSVTVGGYVVWVRGTSANVVELFVGRGFRDAFARAHDMDAARLQHWIDSVRALAPLPADDSSAASAGVRGSAMGADVSLMRRVGGPFSGLRLVAGEETVTMAEQTAREFIVALDSAAHVARELSPPATAVASVAVRAPVPTLAPVVAPAAAPALAPAPTPPAIPQVAAATLEAPPELVLPRPSAPVILLASRVDFLPLPLPTPAVPPAIARTPVTPEAVAPVVVVSAPVPLAVVPLAVVPVAVVPVAVAAAPVVRTSPKAAPAPVAPAPVAPAPAPPQRDTAVASHLGAPADKLIHTPLGPFTIPAALLADRDVEAQYCYTQLGLKYSPDLRGEITVKLSVGGDGAVLDAVVIKRTWQGISAGEVESCVRALARDWTFAPTDSAVAAGAKLLTFRFGP